MNPMIFLKLSTPWPQLIPFFLNPTAPPKIQRTSSSRRTDSPNRALDRLKAFSSIRRHPASSIKSANSNITPPIKQNQQSIISRSASKTRRTISSLENEGNLFNKLPRNPLQISKSLHDVPESCIEQEIEETQDGEKHILQPNQS